jgi:hypothetical protein
VTAVPGLPAHLLDVTKTGGPAGAVAAFACNLPLKPTASVVGRDYAAPGIGAGPSIRRLLVLCPGRVAACTALTGTVDLVRALEAPRVRLFGCRLA